VSEIAGQIDIAPTILAAVGGPHADLPGRNLAKADRVSVYVADNLLYGSAEVPQFAVREGSWKLIQGPRGAELYDLARDPEEALDVAAQHPEVVRRLVEVGLQQPRPQAEPDTTTPELLDALRSLGYIK
jgi:arylsulfatase A-like enzyme